MQEWVDTLRLKLREMKILSPKENLYSKLPEIRPPLLPTRDPRSDPLPATPPVPAAIVPGVIVNTPQTSRITTLPLASATSNVHVAGTQSTESNSSNTEGSERIQNRRNTSPLRDPIENENDASSEDSFSVEAPSTSTTTTTTAVAGATLSSTSNTLSQNLIKMLYPLPNFTHQASDLVILPSEMGSDDSFISENLTPDIDGDITIDESPDDNNLHSLARTFAANVLFDPNTSSSSKRSQNAASNSTAQQSHGASTNSRDVAEGNFNKNIE